MSIVRRKRSTYHTKTTEIIMLTPNMSKMAQLISQRKRIPITLDQMSRLSPPRSQLPIPQLLKQSSLFLQDQLPVRLLKRHLELQSFISNAQLKQYQWLTEPVQKLSSCFLTSCEQLHVSDDATMKPEQFRDVLESARTTLDEELEAMMQSVHYKMSSGTVSVPQQELNHVLNSVHRTMISMRVLIAQYSLLVNHQLASSEASNSVNTDQLSNECSVVNSNTNLMHLLRCVAEDTQALCVEKLGEAPNVETKLLTHGDEKGTNKVTMVSVESHIYFILMELLKNAMRAVLDQQNRTGIENQVPIQIHLAHTNQEVSIRVSDTGGGLKNHDRSRTIFDYFYSTAPRFEPTYTYSGNFGAPFTGLGCGLPIARQYARFYGGDLRVATLPGYGTDVYLHLNRNGITHEEVH